MRLRVGLGRHLVYDGQQYQQGDEFDVSEESAANWLATGLVLPASGVWSDSLSVAPVSAPEPRQRPTVKPAAKPGEYVPHEPCEQPQTTGKRAGSVCSVAGCPCIVPKAGECVECRRAHNRHRTRKREHLAYQRKDWKATRRDYLRAHPLCECEDCTLIAEPLRPAAQVVDHIDGLGPLAPLGHDWSNLRAMTKRCHDRRTMRDQVNGA
ncbi:HNH endonuclease [Streptomyces sp. NBC_00208]|uniref:HNH endonuclease signature motif containing protein n=1 Tax=Streptomyces sp. NBC_00208 TaxID=2975681 RepID=UPI002E2E066A|nr:HNH endonuclease signature motif containing protein [Streptomyces sp. NBC_00208]